MRTTASLLLGLAACGTTTTTPPLDQPGAEAFEPYFYEHDDSAAVLPHRFMSSGEGDLDPDGRKWSYDLAIFPDGDFVARYQEYRRLDDDQTIDREVVVLSGAWSIDGQDRMVVDDHGLAVPDGESLLFGFQRPLLSPEIDGVATWLQGVWSNVGPEDWE